MGHAAEWGRFYWPDGRPAYEVPSADGRMIAPDIRHAKKLKLKPSVTTICAEAAKPGLERWKISQAIVACLTLPRNPDEALDDFAQRALRDSQEQARKAAERGTAIHAAIQGFYERRLREEYYEEYVSAVLLEVDGRYGFDGWRCEETILRSDYGGKRDLRKPGVTLDFKTKEFDEDHKKLAYDEHCIQLAAYREPGDRCANVFISVNNPGLVHIHEWTEEELRRGLAMFNALKDYWYARTGMAR